MQELLQQMAEQMPIVVRSLNEGFAQTLRLFFVTLLGALPLGLVISFGSMSTFKPLKWLTKTVIFCPSTRISAQRAARSS